MALEAQRVPALRRGSAVVAPAVRLHDQSELGPEEADLEFVDRDFREGDRQSGRGRKRAEQPFQLVA
jgi:hypothetical protein